MVEQSLNAILAVAFEALNMTVDKETGGQSFAYTVGPRNFLKEDYTEITGGDIADL